MKKNSMNDYTYLAKELTSDKQLSNSIDIGTINSIDPMSISLSDITLDQDDIILTDKISKLITPIIPEVECNISCGGECSCSCECKIKEDTYNEDKLDIGDKVILQGIEDGQRYIVLDRVYL